MAVSNLRLGGITSGFDTEAMVTQLLLLIPDKNRQAEPENHKVIMAAVRLSGYHKEDH